MRIARTLVAAALLAATGGMVATVASAASAPADPKAPPPGAAAGVAAPAPPPAAPPAALGRTLVIGVAPAAPFAIQEDDGTWSGLSIELWQSVATSLGVGFEYRAVPLAGIDGLLRDGAVDAVLGAIVISEQGEIDHDYSQPYLATGLGFADRSNSGLSWRALVTAFVTSDLLRVVTLMVVATILVGVLIAVLERRHNAEEFGGRLGQSLATGVWWAAVTMTTIGDGERTPRTRPGRLLALVWMFLGVTAVAIFTATVTSVLTVGSLRGIVDRPSDLLTLRLGAMRMGIATEYLRHRHAKFTTFETPEDMLQAVLDGKVDAVLAALPVLRATVNSRATDELRVSPLILEPVSYAIGLPTGSPLRESINRAVLATIEEDRWRDVERSYLGQF